MIRIWRMSLAIAWLLSGCCKTKPPAEGAKCTTPDAVECVSGTEGMACVGGAWLKVGCNGPSGCASHICDDSKALEGTGCPHPSEIHACSVDGIDMLYCNAHKWTIRSKCRGGKGCIEQQKGLKKIISCDSPHSEPGDPCTEDEATCSVNGKTLLKCKNDKYTEKSNCYGPQGCKVEGNKVHCDLTSGEVGAVCSDEDDGTCSSDAKSILICKDGKLKLHQNCTKFGRRCTLMNEAVGCR